MALELIQNEDDAKAESTIFDITDSGLFVINSGTFTDCGDLHTRPCGFTAATTTQSRMLAAAASSSVAITLGALGLVSSRRTRLLIIQRSGPRDQADIAP